MKENAPGKDIFLHAFHHSPCNNLLYIPSTGMVADVNKSFIRLTGYKRRDLVNHPLFDLPVFKNLCEIKKIKENIRDNKEFLNVPGPLLSQSNKEYTVLFSYIPIKGEHDLSLIQVQNITKEVILADSHEALCNRYRNIVSHINTCVVIFQVRDHGEKFIFTDFNRAAEKTENIKKENVIGKDIREVFPGVEKFGLLDVLREVYRTGQPKKHPLTLYQDNRITGWRENYVYKLSEEELLVTYEDRTREKQYEEKLRENEKKFRELADLLPEVVFEADAEGYLTYVNKMALKSFRYPRKEFLRKVRLYEMIAPEDRLRARREILRQLRGKVSTPPEEFNALRKDGSLFPISFKVSPIIKKDELQGMRGILTDLTTQKKIQEHLKRDKIYLEQLIQMAPEAIVQTYKDGTVVNINNEFTHLFGYEGKEIQGMVLEKLISGKNAEALEEALHIRDTVSNGNKVEKETIRYRKDGSPVNVSLLSSPIIFEGRMIGYYTIYRDISEQKRNEKITEVILNISTAALIATSQKHFFRVIKNELEKIVNTKNIFIAMYDRENNMLHFPYYVNEKNGKEIFREISADGTISGYVIRHRKPLLLRAEDINKLVKQGEIEMIGTPSKVWLGVPLMVDQQIIGVISIQDYEDENALTIQDLNILKIISNQIALTINHIRADEMLRIAKEKAEENAIFKEQFLSTMSHEIRTPLNAIIGISRLLSKSILTDNQKEYIKALRISGENLLRLINDILDFSKLEAGKMLTENVEFNPKDQIKMLEQTYAFSAREKGLSMNFWLDKNIPDKLIGDSTKINQILINLIGNAIKFTKEGSITVRVKILREDKENIVLEYSVSDTGIGIPKNKFHSIFESFTQAERSISRRFGGTGLGLAISRKIARLLNSDINVKSTDGKGSTFSFALTLKKALSSDMEKKETDFNPEYLKGKKALIVEDNVLNRIVVRQNMKEWGMIVDEADNGQEAVEKVRHRDYDIVLMDLQMPVMDGYKATRLIRQLPDKKKSQVPIIALTASALLGIRTQAYEYGMNNVLLKPFKPDELQKMIFDLTVNNK